MLFSSRWGFILSAVGSAVGMANVWGFPAKMGANGGGYAVIIAYDKIMMPIFFIIFVVLAIRVSFLPGAAEGYKFMFTPEWTMLKNPMTWIWAMGQEEINKGASKPHGSLWHHAGRFLYVLCALTLCLVALFMKVAF